MSTPSALYENGNVILDNPIESAAVFLAVVIMAACIEYLFGLSHEIQSKFYRSVFDTVSEEVLVLGSLSLLLTFGTSFAPTLSASWAVMIQWAHVCLLFMGIMFVILILILVALMITSNSKWKKFELTRLGTAEQLEGRELKFKQSLDQFIVACSANGCRTDVSFADYLLKAEKKNIITLGDLTWKSWLALSVVVILNALRTKLNPTTPSETDPNKVLDETDSMVNTGAYIALVGYGTLLVYIVVHMLLQQRIRQYLLLLLGKQSTSGGDRFVSATSSSVVDNSLSVGMLRTEELDDPQSFLLWQRNSSTMVILQIIFIFFVWYGAIFALNFMYAVFTFKAGFILLFLVLALIPFVVYIFLMPWTLTTVAILSSLGTNLNKNWVAAVGEAADERLGLAKEVESKFKNSNRNSGFFSGVLDAAKASEDRDGEVSPHNGQQKPRIVENRVTIDNSVLQSMAGYQEL